MKTISLNTRAYYISHREILTGHLIPWPRRGPIFAPLTLEDEDDVEQVFEFEYPTKDDMATMTDKGYLARVDELAINGQPTNTPAIDDPRRETMNRE